MQKYYRNIAQTLLKHFKNTAEKGNAKFKEQQDKTYKLSFKKKHSQMLQLEVQACNPGSDEIFADNFGHICRQVSFAHRQQYPITKTVCK